MENVFPQRIWICGWLCEKGSFLTRLCYLVNEVSNLAKFLVVCQSMQNPAVQQEYGLPSAHVSGIPLASQVGLLVGLAFGASQPISSGGSFHSTRVSSHVQFLSWLLDESQIIPLLQHCMFSLYLLSETSHDTASVWLSTPLVQVVITSWMRQTFWNFFQRLTPGWPPSWQCGGRLATRSLDFWLGASWATSALRRTLHRRPLSELIQWVGICLSVSANHT